MMYCPNMRCTNCKNAVCKHNLSTRFIDSETYETQHMLFLSFEGVQSSLVFAERLSKSPRCQQ